MMIPTGGKRRHRSRSCHLHSFSICFEECASNWLFQYIFRLNCMQKPSAATVSTVSTIPGLSIKVLSRHFDCLFNGHVQAIIDQSDNVLTSIFLFLFQVWLEPEISGCTHANCQTSISVSLPSIYGVRLSNDFVFIQNSMNYHTLFLTYDFNQLMATTVHRFQELVWDCNF